MAQAAHQRLVHAAIALAALASMALAAAPAGAIVGGSPIAVARVPWTVFIHDARASESYLCTGSILDATHVLTAAHCLYDDAGTVTQPDELSVEAGVSNALNPLPTDAPQRVEVSGFRIDPGYDWSRRSTNDDVAVLTLSQPLDLSGPDARAVRLPRANIAFPASVRATVAGFGSQRAGVPTDGTLEAMSATVQPQGRCGQSAEGGLMPDDAIVLCTYAPHATTCTGDSGAALVTAGSTPTLIGLVESGSADCAPGSYPLFTYVGAAEIRRFILGDPRPPVAPRELPTTFINLSWTPPLVVGASVECSSGDWGRPVSLRYALVTPSGATLGSRGRGTFTIGASALGQRLACQVTAIDAGGSALGQTSFTVPVAPPPPLSIAAIPPLRVKRGEVLVLHVSLHAPRGLSGRFGACVTPPAAVGNRDCSSLGGQRGGAGWFAFVLSFRVRPGAPLGAAQLTIDAVAGAAVARAHARALIEP